VSGNVSALKIHMSEDAHNAITAFPVFFTECRGDIAVKVEKRLLYTGWPKNGATTFDAHIFKTPEDMRSQMQLPRLSTTRYLVFHWQFANIST